MTDLDGSVEKIMKAVWQAVSPHIDTMRLRAASDAIDRVAVPVLRDELESYRPPNWHDFWAKPIKSQALADGMLFALLGEKKMVSSSFRLSFTPEGIARVYLAKHLPEASEDAHKDLIECIKLLYNQGLLDARDAAAALCEKIEPPTLEGSAYWQDAVAACATAIRKAR